MRAAIYARVSTPRQARERNTDQQVARLERYAEQQGWALHGERVYLDEGYSGASLSRPGLDALRDAAGIARRLVAAGVLTPTGKISWSRSTIRGILKNPAYGHCTQLVPSKARRSPLEPVGAGLTAKRRPEEEWIGVSVPEIVERETFHLVQHKLSHNRKFAPRNNKSHRYLLRTLVSCGACGQGATPRSYPRPRSRR